MMCSLRRLSFAAALGLIALWSGCGGVADPGPLTGYESDGGGAGDDTGGSAADDGSAGSRAAGGSNEPDTENGSSSSEGVDPELAIDGSGGAVGAGGTSGGSGAGPAGTGGAQPAGSGGTESGSGGTDGPGSGGTESGSGGTSEPGTGGTESGSGGTSEPGAGGAEPGTGGTDEPGSGGTEPGSGGTFEPGTGGTFDPGTGGTESGAGGTESGAGGAGDEVADGGTGGEVGQGGGGQGGSDEPPPVVDVEVGACEPFEACGGDVEGVWTYTAACVDLADLGVDEDQIQAMCAGAELTLAGQVSGTLTFADGVVTRRGRSSAQGQVFVPGLCAIALGGCAGVEAELSDAGITGARCAAQGILLPSCRCSFALDAPLLEEVPFVTEGGVIHLADGRDLEYCAEGDNLSYREVGTTTEPGVRELQRR